MPTLDQLRTLAFRHVFVLQRGGEAVGEDETDPRDLLDALTPAERERVGQLARRRLAMQVLFELDAAAREHADPEAAAEAVLARVEDLGPIDLDRVKSLVVAAYDARAASDAEFGALAPEWPAYRQPAVDRAILRLARAEIEGKLADARIVVSEAVELAKAFSTERSPAFVNALLDKVLKRAGASPE
jgi:transcription antitermination protein NusB